MGSPQGEIIRAKKVQKKLKKNKLTMLLFEH